MRSTVCFEDVLEGDEFGFLDNSSPVMSMRAVVYKVEPTALAMIVTHRDPGRADLPANGSLFWLLGTFNLEKSRGAPQISCPHLRGVVDVDGITTVELSSAAEPEKVLLCKFRSVEIHRGGQRVTGAKRSTAPANT